MMKQIDLKNIEHLTKLQNELNKVINEHIVKEERKDLISSISELGFSKLRNIFECVTPKIIENKEGSKLIRKYVKLMKESNDLNSACRLHRLINETHSFNNGDMLLSESLNIVKSKNDFKNISKDIKKLGIIVSECVDMSNISNEEIKSIINSNNIVSESLDYLICNNKNLNNIDTYLKNFTIVSNYISENAINEEVCEFDKEEIIKNLSENINKDNVWEKTLLEDITLMYLSNDNESKLFEDYINKCINKIDTILSETLDINVKMQMNTMKEDLMTKTYLPENFSLDMKNLAELNYTLSQMNNNK